MPVVAAYGMLAYRLAFYTCSEVTFNPTFFYFRGPFLNELNSKFILHRSGNLLLFVSFEVTSESLHVPILFYLLRIGV